jgi:hypothetical protein
MQMRTVVTAIAAAIAVAGVSVAQDALPNPIKTCADIRAYIRPDGTMTMDTFKQVLIAGGMEWNDYREDAMNKQCKVTTYVKNAIMIQHVAGSILVTTRVVTDNDVCKLTEISLSNC